MKDILFEAWAYCDMEDKSTAFMLHYMVDKANIDFWEVIDFITENSEKDIWYKENPDWFKKYQN